jgi:hypothetical protein
MERKPWEMTQLRLWMVMLCLTLLFAQTLIWHRTPNQRGAEAGRGGMSSRCSGLCLSISSKGLQISSENVEIVPTLLR